MTGTLYLIPSPLGENFDLQGFPPQIGSVVARLEHFIVENEKQARRLIKKITPDKSQSTLHLYPLNKHTPPESLVHYLDPCKSGTDMGLISDAGCPAIADPGAVIVAQAHRLNLKVKPLIGPSSILMAMMSSGLNGQNFAFNGYLPIDKQERKTALKKLEARSLKSGQSQIFMETPYRNEKLWAELLKTLTPETLLCIAYELTQPDETIRMMTVGQWKKVKMEFHKKPAIFILHKNP
jgi:16S rRNA (cytidine1402-2'-O)-methyltransferase